MHRCVSSMLCIAAGLGRHVTQAQHVVPLDAATANSVFSSGGFPAEDALQAGPGYWCRWIVAA